MRRGHYVRNRCETGNRAIKKLVALEYSLAKEY